MNDEDEQSKFKKLVEILYGIAISANDENKTTILVTFFNWIIGKKNSIKLPTSHKPYLLSRSISLLTAFTEKLILSNHDDFNNFKYIEIVLMLYKNDETIYLSKDFIPDCKKSNIVFNSLNQTEKVELIKKIKLRRIHNDLV